jgi:hypothetical protein
MAKFESKYAGLILQDEEGVWAKFEGGEFETTDAAVIARLRKAEDVSEVKKSSAKSDD